MFFLAETSVTLAITEKRLQVEVSVNQRFGGTNDSRISCEPFTPPAVDLLDLIKQIWKLQPKMSNGKPPILILATAAMRQRQVCVVANLGLTFAASDITIITIFRFLFSLGFRYMLIGSHSSSDFRR
jgi:hypothetical protein